MTAFELCPGRMVGEGHPVFIIAEGGINHQGQVDIAKKLIEVAWSCGADCVKFQKRNVDRILTKEGLQMPYVNENSFGKTYGEHKRVLELGTEAWNEMKRHSDKLGVFFTASGWDEESVDFLDALGVPFFKMASADLTNFPLLVHTAKKGKPMILSTGMADLEMVRRAYNLVRPLNNRIVLLQCTSTYPAKYAELNLKVMQLYKREFPDAVIGYSGHENGISITEAAVAMGAHVVERHFTLDRTMKGNDHAASLEPVGLMKLIRDIRNIEEALGTPVKRVMASEKPVFKKLAKSIVTAVDVKKGQVLTREMLTTKGPGSGISPMRMNEVVGSKVVRDIPADVVLKDEDVELKVVSKY